MFTKLEIIAPPLCVTIVRVDYLSYGMFLLLLVYFTFSATSNTIMVSSV